MYNGIPFYEVGIQDFMLITESFNGGSRLLARNIDCDTVRDVYQKSRDNKFGVYFNGVMLDMRKLK